MTIDNDIAYMKMALDEAAKSRSEDDRVHPRVGVVVVKDGQVLARAHRSEAAPGARGVLRARAEAVDRLAGGSYRIHNARTVHNEEPPQGAMRTQARGTSCT